MMPLVYAGLGACLAVTVGLALHRLHRLPGWITRRRAGHEHSCDDYYVSQSADGLTYRFVVESGAGVTVTITGLLDDPDALARAVWHLPEVMCEAAAKTGGR